MGPDYLTSHFVFRSDTLTYNLRDSNCLLAILQPPLIIVKEVCPTAELYCGNSLPLHIRQSPSLSVLKSKLKNFDSSRM